MNLIRLANDKEHECANFEGMRLGDKVMNFLGENKKIRMLNLSLNHISAKGVLSLVQMKQLVTVNVSFNPLGDEGPFLAFSFR